MRRRRQKNTLLPKMIGLAVLINAILLPILAQFGVFKSIGGPQRKPPIELENLPPVPKPPPQPKKVVKKQAAKPHPAGHKTTSRPMEARRTPGPPPVHVVAVGTAAGGSGGGGDAGITTSGEGPVGPPGPPPAPSQPPPHDTTPPVITPPVVTPPVGTTPPVIPPPPPPPHVPVLTVATPLQKPEPSIPDDLRDVDLDANFQALFTVHADGTASVKVVSGTGNPALDALALDAARRWTFRPATRDGQPVESFLRLRIEFNVNS